MTYERKKLFVLGFLADHRYHVGRRIVEGSNGLLRRKTAYQTFDRMVEENLIHARGEGRTWEREYRRV